LGHAYFGRRESISERIEGKNMSKGKRNGEPSKENGERKETGKKVGKKITELDSE
jgi:hypothetical protein